MPYLDVSANKSMYCPCTGESTRDGRVCMSTLRACAEACTCAILLHCAWTFLSIRACATPAWVCLQELFCCTWTCLHVYMYKGLCCTCSRVNVCFFVLHMHVRVCIQELFATPGRFCLAPGTPGFARSTHKLFGLFRKTTD